MAVENLTDSNVKQEHEVRPKVEVCITGIGSITPLGLNTKSSFEAALAGKSGATIYTEDPRYISRVATVVKDFNPREHLFLERELRELSDMSRAAQFSCAATREALLDAKLLDKDYFIDESIVDPHFVGVRIGTGLAGGEALIEAHNIRVSKGPQKIKPSQVFKILSDRVATVPSMLYRMKGPLGTSEVACATGLANIIDAVKDIRDGNARVSVAGGAEAALIDEVVAGFGNMRAMATKFQDEPKKASRPFDKDRSGFVIGEGAVVLVVEEKEHALRRGATIYADLVDYWSSADADHRVKPSAEEIAFNLNQAHARSKIEPGEVDLIVAHATATDEGDVREMLAFERVYGNHLPTVSITAPKGGAGHMLCAAASLNAMTAVMAIKTGRIPPTVNLENPGDEFRGLRIVRGSAEHRDVRTALATGFGFGGVDCSALFRKSA